VVVVSVGHGEVDAAVRPVGQAAAVEGDAAGGEEGGPRHRLVVDVADEARARLPLDLEGTGRGRVRSGPGLARLHLDRAEADLAVGLQPGDVPCQVNAGDGGGRAALVVGGGERRRRVCGRHARDDHVTAADHRRSRVGPGRGRRGGRGGRVRPDLPGQPGPGRDAARRPRRGGRRGDRGDRHRACGQRGQAEPAPEGQPQTRCLLLRRLRRRPDRSLWRAPACRPHAITPPPFSDLTVSILLPTVTCPCPAPLENRERGRSISSLASVHGHLYQHIAEACRTCTATRAICLLTTQCDLLFT
jgi:hypothetical protein